MVRTSRVAAQSRIRAAREIAVLRSGGYLAPATRFAGRDSEIPADPPWRKPGLGRAQGKPATPTNVAAGTVTIAPAPVTGTSVPAVASNPKTTTSPVPWFAA
jgi:hypothetical protein